ncbi:MAG TPA: hypothetical protein PLQ20_01435 [Candidatus Paceibacterota bacterium]|nr:hypothetical protein [Candidatus Paceibacterota bacterium]
MKINFKKTNLPKHKKDGRINPHRFWLFIISIFIIVLTLQIIYFTYFFTASTKKLDEQVMPKLDTNSAQINKIEKTIESVENALTSRVGNI